jgi:hypothetical protein
VDTQATDDAMKALLIARQHCLAKQASGLCPGGKNMLRRKKWTHSKCPRCDHPVEDSEHVFRCKGSGAMEKWDITITALAQWMRTQRTAIAITKAICNDLRVWYTDQPMGTEGYTNSIGGAVEQQTRLASKAMGRKTRQPL